VIHSSVNTFVRKAFWKELYLSHLEMSCYTGLHWERIFSFKCVILITVVVLSVIFYRPFCKWICPLGAIYSLFNKVSFLSIKVENSKCVGCGQCSTACKMDVDVCKTPDHPECIRCGACIKACPKDAIHYEFMGNHSS